MSTENVDERVDLSNSSETLYADLYNYVSPKGLFKRPNAPIKQLLLRQNGLIALEAYDRAFLAMRHSLRELSLKENCFVKVPSEILLLASLTSLSLASNQISSIEENVLSHLKHLQWLSLSCNELATLPNDLVECRKLKGLDIHSNRFEGVPPIIQGLKRLQILLIQKNQLKGISNDLIFPDSLHTLNLSFNEIDHIPHTLIYHPPEQLTHLYLSGNPLRRIPSNFLSVGYKHLISLDIHTCHIASIDGDFFIRLGERKLRRLNLAINVLEELPLEIGHLTHVEWLNLNDNRLKHLPVTLSNLTRLVKLGLVQNRLKYLPPRLFSRMYKLQKLDIRRNHLRYLPASILMMSPFSDVISNPEIAVPMAAFQMHPCPPTCQVQSRTDADQGGSLRTLLLGENLSLEWANGIIHEGLPSRYSTEINSDIDDNSTLEAFDGDNSGRYQLGTCDSYHINSICILSLRETAIRVLLNRGYGRLQRLPLAVEEPPSICLEHSLGHYHSQLDLYPEYAYSYLEEAIPHSIPSVLRMYIIASARQCDNCGKWYSKSHTQIGYTVRLGTQKTMTPIRFQLCSMQCADNSIAVLHRHNDTWESLRQNRESENMEISRNNMSRRDQQSNGWFIGGSSNLLDTFKHAGRYILSVLNLLGGNQHQHLGTSDDMDPPALFAISRQSQDNVPIRVMLSTTTPSTTAFNHLPRDAIRLERF